MDFLYFFGDRVEVLEDGVSGGSGEVKGSAPSLALCFLWDGGVINFLRSALHYRIFLRTFVSNTQGHK